MKLKLFFYLIVLSIHYSCIDRFEELNDSSKIILSAEVNQESVTRVNDGGFADGDNIGIYIVDYEGTSSGQLKPYGNRASNVRFTYHESSKSWTGSNDVYWKDNHTSVDIYGYYPFNNAILDNTTDFTFSVQRDQSTLSQSDQLGGYEKSDFLWGKVSDVSPTDKAIMVPLSHKLSSARVTLTEGDGFDNDEWENISKQVLVSNVARDCEISMATGEVKSVGATESTSTIPYKVGNEWRAIVVPQTVQAQQTLFVITVDGKPYKFTKNEAFVYQQGKMSNFTIRVDKRIEEGTYKLTLIAESIIDWENDLVSHDAVAKEYFVVRTTPGRLREDIMRSGNDFHKVKNMKILGTINSWDFYFMRDSMDVLAALNLKQVRIKGLGASSVYGITCIDDQIPGEAFFRNDKNEGKSSLCSVILPDTLVSIGNRAFRACRNLTGSLIIPEGVVDIQQGAYSECSSLNGRLYLPSTLRKLGNCGDDSNQDTRDEGIDYYGGVFQHCSNLTGDLIIPDGVELIRGYCFEDCRGLTGKLHLPEKLKRIGNCAFSDCHGLNGSLEIPRGVTNIPSRAFWDCDFDGQLILHDGITTIESNAFGENRFKGELILPKYLQTISNEAFYKNNFSGALNLPKTLLSIGDRAFSGNGRIKGVVEIPEGVVSIGEGAFSGCASLEGLVLPESMEIVRYAAFYGCYGINSIVCRGTIPPTINKAFEGVSKGNFVVEVPESSVIQYSTAAGWRDFKRIVAHHELFCSPSIACALSTQHKQTLVVYAEGEWEIKDKPSWCEVSPSSGNKKTEVTLTIAQMNTSDETRTGDIVFNLKDKGYTHSCHVSQYGYKYEEDDFLSLQKASEGKRGGINIVVMGDGYDAKDISSGKYLSDMNSQVERFFDIEPYTTYRKYFNVYTAFPLSTESGVGSVNTIVYNKFSTTFTGGVGMKADYDEIFDYVLHAPTITRDNLSETLIILVPNSTEYGGITQMWEDGRAISFCPISTDDYPYDARGVIQHEAGGHGFGKLADEYIYHNTFIDACGCICCGHVDELKYCQSLGWYNNISLSNKVQQVPWKHLIYDKRYSDIVDIYEGAFMHNRGVFRSEHNSCMNNDIPYFNTISRESIVRRIMNYAGETFSFDAFVAKDSRRSTVNYMDSKKANVTRSNAVNPWHSSYHHSPVIHKR